VTRVPTLTEAALRAWGTDDELVVSALAHENQAGAGPRARAVGERARAAGWPQELACGNDAAKRAISQAMRRLEGMDFSFQGRYRRRQQQRQAAARWDALDVDTEGGDWDGSLLLLPELEAAD
jgi:hypothetical protein